MVFGYKYNTLLARSDWVRVRKCEICLLFHSLKSCFSITVLDTVAATQIPFSPRNQD